METQAPDAMPGWKLPAFTTAVTVPTGGVPCTSSVTAMEAGLTLGSVAAIVTEVA